MLGLVSAVAAASAAVSVEWQAVKEAIDSYEMVPSVSFSVANASGVIFTHNKGGAHLDTEQNIWSSTKFVAGVGIMKEVQEGRIKLDEPVSTYLKYWTTDKTDSRSQITLRHLLAFASGYQDMTQVNGYMLPLGCITGDLQRCAEATYMNSKVHYPPADGIDYNSVHLTLAGAVAEAATGKRMIDILKANVFEPAGMKHTYFRDHSEDAPFLAGGLMSTPRDYLAFLRGIFHNELLSAETRATMFADAFPNAPKTGIFETQKTATRYGLANWLECPDKSNPEGWRPSCAEDGIHSSPGASGTYPLIDLKNGYYYFFGFDGSFPLGSTISNSFRDILKPLVDSAVAGKAATGLPTRMPASRLNCLRKAAVDSANSPRTDPPVQC